MNALPNNNANIPKNARGNIAPQLALLNAPGVSTSALIVPAIDARIVPRMVCGRVNLYKARSRALIDPASMSSFAFDIALGSKSPSTPDIARLVVVDELVVAVDVVVVIDGDDLLNDVVSDCVDDCVDNNNLLLQPIEKLLVILLLPTLNLRD
jgi:hypothetical protein